MGQQSTSSTGNSKLWIRSEVLSVIGSLSSLEQPARQDRQRQLRRLRTIDNRPAIQAVLLRELARSTQLKTTQVIGELLMEFGDIEHLQQPLWELIRQSDISDDVKDVANLVLRHLGDASDPEEYLSYLDDPVGLINRETQRMLEVAEKNPEALIDFLDFITSLPVSEQMHLVQSLHGDYEALRLLKLDEALLFASQDEALCGIILDGLGKHPCPAVSRLLVRYERWLEASLRQPAFSGLLREGDDSPVPTEKEQREEKERRQRLLQHVSKIVTKARLSGVFKDPDALLAEPQPTHALLQATTLGPCYCTLPDGVGNQGFFVTRQWPNGDYSLVCLALSDLHGVLDAFGFYQLSGEELEKIRQKFHEDNSKIEVDAAYCLQRFNEAKTLSAGLGLRLPYEAICWQVILGDAGPPESVSKEWLRQHSKPEYAIITDTLYQHPDFGTWFLDEDDLPGVGGVLAELPEQVERLAKRPGWPANAAEALTPLVERVEAQLYAEPLWLDLLAERLGQVAYLLLRQQAPTFSTLAATEALRLADAKQRQGSVFVTQYARKCVQEGLQRLRFNDFTLQQSLAPAQEALQAAWTREI